jgi:hypothetical protein
MFFCYNRPFGNAHKKYSAARGCRADNIPPGSTKKTKAAAKCGSNPFFCNPKETPQLQKHVEGMRQDAGKSSD